MSKSGIQRLCRTAIMVALYVLLTMVSIRFGNLRVTFASLPLLVAALLYGPWEAAAVAIMGEFLLQMLSYGFTATTVLWLLPGAARGVLIGLAAARVRKTGRPLERRGALCYAVCVGAAAVTTLLNTAVIYVDSRLMGYYSPAYVFGDALLRLATGMVTAVLLTTLAIPLIRLLRSQLVRSPA